MSSEKQHEKKYDHGLYERKLQRQILFLESIKEIATSALFSSIWKANLNKVVTGVNVPMTPKLTRDQRNRIIEF